MINYRFHNSLEKSIRYAEIFVGYLEELKINFTTGIPCGVQKHLIKNLILSRRISHIISNSEQESIGIAAGAYLAGKKPLVYMQNSGFFASSNDIASLLIPYKIPILFTVTWRGLPTEDAPQHKVTGNSTIELISSLGLGWGVLSKSNSKEMLKRAMLTMEGTSLPFIILIKRGWDE